MNFKNILANYFNYQYIILYLSVLSLTVGTISILYSRQDKIEIIDINIKPYEKEYRTKIIEHCNKDCIFGSFYIWFECTIFNNSMKNVTIKKSEIIQAYKIINIDTTINIEPKFFQESDYENILPLNIEEGNFKKIIIEINLIIDPRSFHIIKTNFNDLNNINSKALFSCLDEYYLDIYGNFVINKKVHKEQDIQKQVFLLKFTSSRDNRFSQYFSLTDNYKIIKKND
jgi:hypothetical protein